jgi:signal transduction histidine kinase
MIEMHHGASTTSDPALEAERRLRLAAEQRARAAEQAAARAARMHVATAALAEARGRDEAARVLLEHAAAALRASTGHVCIVAERTREAEILAHVEDAPAMGPRRLPLDDAAPIEAALTTGATIRCGVLSERAARFPTTTAANIGLSCERFIVAPLVVRGRATAAIVLGFDADRVLDVDESDHLDVLARCAGRALERAALYDAARRACEDADVSRRRLALLSDASTLFASSLDPDETLRHAAEAAVPELCDWCVATVFGDDGVARCAFAHASPAKERRLAELVDDHAPALIALFELDVATRVGRRARPRDDVLELLLAAAALDPRAASILRDVGIVSAIVAPLQANGTRGAVLYASSRVGWSYGSAEIAVAEDLAARSSQALENARLHVEVEKSIAAREELLAMVSLDLKNPLTTILVGASVLLEQPVDAFDAARARKVAGTIQRAAQNMTQLVKDLLDLARIRQGRIPLDPRPCACAHLLEQALSLLQPLAAARRQEIVAAPPDAAMRVRCDPERVLQVFSNVLGNAVKFSPPGARITVDVAREGAAVRFAVKDAGPGLTEEQKARVFDRYWQGTTKDARGSGLGLCIAKGLVEAHGGRIRVDGGVGQGTTVSFTLPAD